MPDSALDTCGWFNQRGTHVSEAEFRLIRLPFHCLPSTLSNLKEAFPKNWQICVVWVWIHSADKVLQNWRSSPMSILPCSSSREQATVLKTGDLLLPSFRDGTLPLHPSQMDCVWKRTQLMCSFTGTIWANRSVGRATAVISLYNSMKFCSVCTDLFTSVTETYVNERAKLWPMQMLVSHAHSCQLTINRKLMLSFAVPRKVHLQSMGCCLLASQSLHVAEES